MICMPLFNAYRQFYVSQIHPSCTHPSIFSHRTPSHHVVAIGKPLFAKFTDAAGRAEVRIVSRYWCYQYSVFLVLIDSSFYN